MSVISPTVLDVDACNTGAGANAMARVASNLAYQFSRHNGWGGRTKVTTADVRAALIAHGASTITVDQFARQIASRIRNDFTDGVQR